MFEIEVYVIDCVVNVVMGVEVSVEVLDGKEWYEWMNEKV